MTAIYTKLDLVSLTGVNEHTIRSWVRKGVIPPPYMKGGREPVRWGKEHLDAINAVKEVKDQNLTFADLRTRWRYKPSDDGFDEYDDFDEGFYPGEDDVLAPDHEVLSLEQLAEREYALNEDDEDEGNWSDTRVHPGWYGR